ncbi:MAG: 2-oxoglutarate and iron-dependent oxygenase domain-containing protein [Cyanobacteria bacterium P01_A01_bin.123]
MLAQTISVLDFQDFVQGNAAQQAAFVQSLGTALEDIGFFALVNHSVEPELIRAAYAAATTFFTLPDDIKRQYEQLELKGQRGFTQFGREHAKDHPLPDLKEFWHVGREGTGGVYLPNLWPREIPEFRTTLLQLYSQLEACADVLLEACALYLGQPRPWLKAMVDQGDTILRVIHYPPVAEDAPRASLRAAPHEDINFITLLCEATEPGLELRQRDDTWLPVQALPGQIIVDTGDMLQLLTNGLLKSTTHRVSNPASPLDAARDNNTTRPIVGKEAEEAPVANPQHSRFSMPFFVHPRREVDLTPIAGCVERTGGVAKFPSLTAGEYLQQRLQEIGLA